MKKKQNKIHYGLYIIGLSFVVSIILGFISCFIHTVITSSYVYLIYPFIITIFTLIVYLVIWILNKDLALIVVLIMASINIAWNVLQLVFVLQ
jgi:hypothetical protein